MSLISENVIEEFVAWAKKNEDKDIFPKISQEVSSYYINRDSERPYIMNISFQNIGELQELLEQYGGEAMKGEWLKMLVTEICQNRYMGSLELENDQKKYIAVSEDKKVLPEYIYVF